ncbi:GDP-fucose protein O-fucosyltransferase [Musa troglodytarum]|uniref:O-fucosyltransferase family protein n=1 Tax=Musa troglodytarum TaxID=320322 RepID=A0A9E7II62_9LILI|nr:GDP-fucose protein O-fucosyltransferase [Musa troglodytarum]
MRGRSWPVNVGGGGAGKGGTSPIVGRVVHGAAAAALRWRVALLLVPLVYVALMLVFVGWWNLEAVPVRVGVPVLKRAPPPGSVYRSPQLMMAWHQKTTQKWKPCLRKRSLQAELSPSNGFLIIEANGGLNQQRLSISDAVAVAGILNATLVIPIFHFNSVWCDSSKFKDIFDEEYFIETLKNHVRVVKELPQDMLQRFDNNISNILNMRTKALSSKAYYLQKVLPKLLENGAVRIAPFSYRLAHSVPSSIQRLRCLTNYEALRFSPPIRTLAERMIDRMVKNSSSNGGKYISVHLRFEKDMVAFSCCTYDGGQQEKTEMDKARERGWRGKFNKPGRVIRPEANRRNGKCPLTPLEVGMMLRGMGFGNTTTIYVASGKIYNAQKYMAPLHQLFPLLETKETLASADELAPFKGHSSRLAALDYTVCAHSEVFVTTQGGNFPHFLMGHRRYFNGHSKTIKPDKRKLVLSFDNPNIRWDRFKHHMQEIFRHSDLKGVGLRKRDGVPDESPPRGGEAARCEGSPDHRRPMVQGMGSAGRGCDGREVLPSEVEDKLKALKEKSKETESEDQKPEPATEVLFLCSYEGCGKTFIDAGALKKHAHIHGEKQHVCQYEGCGKNTMVDMGKHAPPVEKPHTSKAAAAANGSASAERPYACPYEGCEKAYIHEYKLNLHLRKEHPGHNSEENGKPAPVVGHGLEEASDQEVYITKGGKNSKRSKPSVAPQMPPAKITNRKGNSVPTNMPAVKKQWASKDVYEEDSEETEEDRDNAEEDGWRYQMNGDDEETEDEE